ncbi:Nuclear transcription factor Y subunit C-8 [Camponotus japonicus]
MPSKKKKYNARFPAGRIKKIMQTDEEVGKVAQAVPIIISRTLELFVHSLLTKTMQITSAKNAKTLSPSHMKQCILSESRFDFLKDLVKSLPDVSGPDDEVPTSPETPAPLQINLPNTTTACSTVTQQSDPLEYQKQLGLPISNESNVNHKSTKDNGSTAVSNNPVNQRAVEGHSQVPEFQISIPASFQISQPNFYTEVNPSASNQPTSNFAHTANIDEDYDT